MMLCVATAASIVALASTAFTLSWTHSVEHMDWWESWRVNGDRLQLVEASVKGPGAGVGLPEGAHQTSRGWTYTPEIRPLARLVLAASGTTLSGWTFCTEDECRELGTEAGQPIEIWSARMCTAE